MAPAPFFAPPSKRKQTGVDMREFHLRVYEAVRAIPVGKVATYGQLAILAGKPGRARHAGSALRYAPEGLPCHRVVNSTGRTTPGWAEQPGLLRREGVAFRPGGQVDMKKHRWMP